MRLTGLLGAALLTLALPGMAQNGREAPAKPKGEAEAALAKLFKVEPLTAEQRVRLPQAEALIAQIMPPGTLDQIMGGMYDKMLGPIMAMAGTPSSAQVARELGIEGGLELSEAEAGQAAAIIDPVWKERGEREMRAVQSAMSKVMRMMEPSMRKGMAEAYAVTFTTAELTDIAAFFATPSGASYARKSYSLATDPRIMAASMEALPILMGEMKALETDVKAATAGLPPKRGFDDLSPAERAALSRLTGRSAAEIRAGMARAARERSEAAPVRNET